MKGPPYRVAVSSSSKRQLPLPAKLLHALGWEPGHVVEIEIQHFVLKAGRRLPFLVIKPAALEEELM